MVVSRYDFRMGMSWPTGLRTGVSESESAFVLCSLHVTSPRRPRQRPPVGTGDGGGWVLNEKWEAVGMTRAAAKSSCVSDVAVSE